MSARDWYKGQKVICVLGFGVGKPTTGQIYTVGSAHDPDRCCPVIELDEFPVKLIALYGVNLWPTCRFKPAESSKMKELRTLLNPSDKVKKEFEELDKDSDRKVTPKKELV